MTAESTNNLPALSSTVSSTEYISTELVDTFADTEEVTDAESDSAEQSDTTSNTWVSVSRFRARQMLPPGMVDAVLQAARQFDTRLLDDVVQAVASQAEPVSLTAAAQTALIGMPANTTLFDNLPTPVVPLGKDLMPSALTADLLITAGQVSPLPDVGSLVAPVLQSNLPDLLRLAMPDSLSGVFTDLAPRIPSLTAMVPRIDMGAACRVSVVADSLRGGGEMFAMPDISLGELKLPHVVRVLDGLPPEMFEGVLQAVGTRDLITSLLGDWKTLALFGHPLADRGMRAARKARRAVLRGERDKVEEFAVVWLGFKKAVGWIVEAVSSALLEDSWLDDEDPTVEHLQDLATYHHRIQKPLWEQKLRAGPIKLLGEPVVGGSNIAVGDTIVSRDALLGEFNDPRVVQVLERLTPEDRDIALAYANGASWNETAEDCGQSQGRGESVRRKLKYRGDQIMKRMRDVTGTEIPA
ncbi:hypothetical protein AB0M12_40205 [Nocardia vinacea]|uniref:hypothetical protein n=1 Tax=Nocardia vinacea TaxID=96468 RepID=UPI0034152BED